MKKSKSQEGTDTQPWVARTVTGRIGKDTFNTFKEANNLAREHTRETGEFAQAVRA